MGFLLFFVFFLLPALEIVVFILVGLSWGWLQALLLTVATTFFGFSLSKYYQFSAKGNLEKVLAGELPDGHIMDNMMRYFACFLLMFPGFITDFCGLFILIPWGRKLVIRLVGSRLSASLSSGFSSSSSPFPFYDHSAGRRQDQYDARFTPSDGQTSHRDGSTHITPNDDDIIDVDFEVKN